MSIAFDPRAWSDALLQQFQDNMVLANMAQTKIELTPIQWNALFYRALQEGTRAIPRPYAVRLRSWFSHTALTDDPNHMAKRFTAVFNVDGNLFEMSTFLDYDVIAHPEKLHFVLSELCNQNNLYTIHKEARRGYNTRGQNQIPNQKAAQQAPSVQPHASPKRYGYTLTGLRVLLARVIHRYRS